MIKYSSISRLALVFGLSALTTALITGCQPQNAGKAVAAAAAAASAATSSTTTTSYSGVNAFQVITKTGASGSFDATAVPASGGVAPKAQRIFGLDGTQIAVGNIPTWYVESRVFLTSTNTSGTNTASTLTGSDTPCAYFDSTATDNNPDSDNYYAIDGFYNPGAGDIDQCAGTTAAELNKLSLYVQVDRRFMNSTDKLQIIVKAKPLDSPNTAPTASSCVVGGYFDPSACSNQYFALSMRTAPYAAAAPFYVLFPSAKSRDLLSETVLLPLQIDSGITTISIDRVKGGALFYGLTVLRLL